MAQVPKAIKVKWPVGPHYSRWVKGKGSHSWVQYKLKTANWFFKTLSKTVHRAENVDRYVGVEMAIDGLLNALCDAFDAAICLLARSLETANGLPELNRTPTENLTWDYAATLATAGSIRLDCSAEVADALSGNGLPEPSGWLAQLQRLRELAARENRLVPHWDLGHGNPGQYIDVPGLGLQEPLPYLSAVREQVVLLVETILNDLESVSATGRSGRDRGRSKNQARPLPDLSARARVVTANRPRGQRGMRPRNETGERFFATAEASGLEDEQYR